VNLISSLLEPIFQQAAQKSRQSTPAAALWIKPAVSTKVKATERTFIAKARLVNLIDSGASSWTLRRFYKDGLPTTGKVGLEWHMDEAQIAEMV